MNAAVVVAAGRGTRMGAGENKVFLPLRGTPVIVRTVRAIHESGLYGRVVVVTGAQDADRMRALLREAGLPADVCAGGADRQQSVLLGLRRLPEETECVSIHDGARPLVTREILAASLSLAERGGSGVAAVPVRDTVRRSDESGLATLNREGLLAMQTPQTFCFAAIRDAHERFENDPARATDDAELYARAGKTVSFSAGGAENLKLTAPEDLRLAEAILAMREKSAAKEERSVRIGHGYDVHRLKAGRKLILCGVEIPHPQGLDGHSDADVALHALMDAMLGAAGLGDIGRHFPDTDEAYAGADSGKLLETVADMVRARGYEVGNADVTIVCQRPKLAPYIEAMRANTARLLRVPQDRVNVKATTTERLGFEGEGLGISCHAVCALYGG